MTETGNSSVRDNTDTVVREHPEAALQGLLDVLHVPVAVLDSSGAILAVNPAWETVFASGSAANIEPGDNYLSFCRTLADDGSRAALRNGAARVLAGVQESFEYRCPLRHNSGEAPNALKFAISRMEHQTPPRFVVSHQIDAQLPATPEATCEAEERVLAARTEERASIAEELHDSVGQNLVCVGLGLTRLRRAGPQSGETTQIISEMADSLQEAHAQIRTVSYLLHPPWPEHRGILEAAIREFAEGFGRRAAMQVTVKVTGFPYPLDGMRELTLFRVLQESLVNIHRHSGADAVTIELSRRGRQVTLKVKDNGHGMLGPDGSAPPPGVGTLGMRARVKQFGGDISLASGPEGTIVTARLLAGAALRPASQLGVEIPGQAPSEPRSFSRLAGRRRATNGHVYRDD